MDHRPERPRQARQSAGAHRPKRRRQSIGPGRVRIADLGRSLHVCGARPGGRVPHRSALRPPLPASGPRARPRHSPGGDPAPRLRGRLTQPLRPPRCLHRRSSTRERRVVRAARVGKVVPGAGTLSRCRAGLVAECSAGSMDAHLPPIPALVPAVRPAEEHHPVVLVALGLWPAALLLRWRHGVLPRVSHIQGSFRSNRRCDVADRCLRAALVHGLPPHESRGSLQGVRGPRGTVPGPDALGDVRSDRRADRPAATGAAGGPDPTGCGSGARAHPRRGRVLSHPGLTGRRLGGLRRVPAVSAARRCPLHRAAR